MILVWLFAAVLVGLGGLVFVSGRRFGLLALGLAMGAWLAEWWSSELAIWWSQLGKQVTGLPTSVLMTLLLTLLPVVAMSLSGPVYQKQRSRVLAAVALVVLAAALLVRPLGLYVQLDGLGWQLYQVVAEQWQLVASAGLLLALTELIVLQMSSPRRGRPKKG